MARFPTNGGPYDIDWSRAVVRTLRRLMRQAIQQGRAESFLAALRQIGRRLEQSPNRFGEPLYRLPGMRLQVRSAVVRPVVVHFAVHEDRPLVFIRRFELLAD